LLHALSLGLVLFVLWVLLSGFFVPLLLSLGAASVVLVVLIAHRMDVIDHEGHPVNLTWRALFYGPWLIKEILVANLDVARTILKRDMPLKAQVLDIKGSQKSELGHVIYGNSITLTPGTITILLEKGALKIHALTEMAATGLLGGDMDRRVTAMEGVVATDPKKDGKEGKTP